MTTKVKILSTTSDYDSTLEIDANDFILRSKLDKSLKDYSITESFLRLLKPSKSQSLLKYSEDMSFTLLLRELLLFDLVFPIVIYPITQNEQRKLDTKMNLLKIRTPKIIYAISISGIIIKIPEDTIIYIIGLSINITRKPLDILSDILREPNILPYNIYSNYYSINELISNNSSANYLPSGLKITNNKISNKLQKNGTYMYYFENLNDTKQIKLDLLKFYRQINDSLKYLLYNSLIYNIKSLNESNEHIFEYKRYNNSLELIKKEYSKLYKVVDLLNKNGIITCTYESLLDTFLVIDHINGTNEYINYIVNGDIKVIEQKISELIISKHQYEIDLSENIERGKKLLLSKTYENIIERKLGHKKILQLKNVISRGQPIAIFNELTQQEQKILDITMKLENSRNESYSTNKCPHVEVYKQLYRANTIKDQEIILKELGGYFSNPKELSEFIKCKLCKLDIICPHALMRFKLTNESPNEIRDKLSIFVTNEFKLDNIYVVYCKICGGYLSKSFGMEVNVGNFSGSILSDYIKHIKYIGYYFSNFLVFETFLNPHTFVNIITKYTIPFLDSIDKDILRWRNKKIKLDQDIKIKIYLNIVVYALILYLLVNDQFIDHLYIRGKKLYGLNRHKEYSSYIFVKLNNSIKYLLETVMEEQKIKERITLGPDFILKKYNDYYKVILNFAKTKRLNFDFGTNSKIELLNYLINTNPVYYYSRQMYLLDNPENINKKMSSNELIKEFEMIMGTSLTEIMKNKQINYSKLYSIKSKLSNNKFIEQAVNTHLVNTWVGGGPKIKNNKKRKLKFYWALGGKVESKSKPKIKKIESKPKKEISNTEITKNYFIETYNLYLKYISEVATSIDPTLRSKYETDLRLYKKAEANYRIQRYHSKPHASLNIIKKITETIDFNYYNNSLNSVYDLNGNRHKWSIYIYDNGSEYTKLEIIKNINLIRDLRIKDRRCSECDILYSEISKLDYKKIEEAINNNYEINKLYNFYINQCPISISHKYDNGKCKSCGFYLNMSKEDRKNYYNKYIENYNSFIQIKPVSPTFVIESEKIIIKDIDWKYDHSVVLKISNEYKLNINALENIGLSERLDYNDVLTDNFQKEEIESIENIQIVVLETYIRELLINYSTIRNINKKIKIPQWVQIILDNIKFPLNLLIKIEILLTPVGKDFIEILRGIKNKVEPNNVKKYLLEYLCKTILTFKNFESKNEEINKLMNEFANYSINRIIDTEKYLSRKSTEFVDTDIADDYQDIDIKDSKFDPFSYEHIDYDGSNDPNIGVS